MFGGILRLLAVGEASRRLGDYLKKLAAKYLVLSVAGMIFLAAIAFGLSAVFWALTSSIQNPAISAAIMAGALALIGLLAVAGAYGIGPKESRSGVRQALSDPARALKSWLPGIQQAGRDAVRAYGPFRVTAAAAAGGLVAGLVASRFRARGPERDPGQSARDLRRLNGRRNRGQYV
jgi:hypothetical protein